MTTKQDREEDRRRRDQEKRLQIQERADRLEALLGGEVWTFSSEGVILTPDQVDALLAMTGPARLFAEDRAANPGKYGTVNPGPGDPGKHDGTT